MTAQLQARLVQGQSRLAKKEEGLEGHSMQQEDVCRILSAAAPESRLAGYAQCFVHIVADSVEDIEWYPMFLKRQFHQPLLAYHLGREAAPILSRGLPGLPAAEQCIRVLKAVINILDGYWSPDWSAQFVKGLLLAAPGALLTLVEDGNVPDWGNVTHFLAGIMDDDGHRVVKTWSPE